MQITIDGEPVPKGRPRVVSHGFRTTAYSPEKSRGYADYVKLMVKSEWQHGKIKRIERPTRVELMVYFFVSTNPWSKPDIINLASEIADCLTGFCYDDDSQITQLICHKFKASKPRVQIDVRALKDQGEVF